MPIPIAETDTALVRAIKIVGIGKKGSRSLTQEEVGRAAEFLRSHPGRSAALGAFLAGLMLKGPSENEMLINEALEEPVLPDPCRVVEYLSPSADPTFKDLCLRLLQHETLSTDDALTLGRFLFADKPDEGLCGLAASALRVRYETPDEYAGLLKAMNETLLPGFCRSPAPLPNPVIQLAEPFDGVDHSYLITPLLADCARREGYIPVSLTGRNSGPKFGLNLYDLAKALDACFLKSREELVKTAPAHGWYAHQATIAPALDRWVEIRHQTIKRPFMATLERFVNPAGARYLAVSAFHPPYAEKMLTIADRAGFEGVIIIRNGREGSLTPYITRPYKGICSCRLSNGEYRRHAFQINAADITGQDFSLEDKLNCPNLLDNVKLIQKFSQTGTSGHPPFDAAVATARAGLRQALAWMARQEGRTCSG